MSAPKTIVIREGDAGLSAYQVAVNNGFEGTEAEWLEALQGGQNGWTPVIVNINDGERCVQQVIDWSGGTGVKPVAGGFIGAAGFVTTAAAATDIRGRPGVGTGVGSPETVRGIASITRTAGTGAAGTTDTYTITFTDSTTSTFQVANGANGLPSTVPGPAGRGVASIARTAGTGAAGTTDTYTITFTDSTTSTFQIVNGADGAASTVPGPAGRGVASIARTAGTGAAGTADTYTITFTDNTTSTFQVVNGANGAASTIPGPAGRGVASIVRTAGTGAAGSTDTYTITFTDDSTTTFQVVNGANGAASTVPGPAGRGVASIARTAGTGAAGTADTYTITFTDSTTSTFQVVNGANGAASTVPGPAGRGVASIARTAGTGAAGTTDTYTITFTDSTTSTFQVVNGANGAASTVPGPAGRGVASIARTAGTGAAGTTDTYTITFTDSSTSTFQVVNGANGAASTVPGPAGRGVASIARTAGTGAAGTTDTYTITFTDSTTSTFQVVNGANGAASTVPGPAGRGVASIARTAGTGAAGTTDTYTITFTDSTTSTFQVVNGATGASAWTPILAVVTDGARRVLQVADWAGGSGTKPTTGAYVGATGLTSTLASAVDIRALANTDGLTEGATNKWFTDARALAAVEASNAAMGTVMLADLPATPPADSADKIVSVQRSATNRRRLVLISDGVAWQFENGVATLDKSADESADLTMSASYQAFSTGVIVLPAKLIAARREYELEFDINFQSANVLNLVQVDVGGTQIYAPAGTAQTRRVGHVCRFWLNTAGTGLRPGAHLSGFGYGVNSGGGFLNPVAYTAGTDLTFTISVQGPPGEIARLWRWRLMGFD